MAFIFASVVTIAGVIFVFSLSERLQKSCFDEKQLKSIRDQRKYVILFGLIVCVLSWWNFYIWNYTFMRNPILPTFLTVITIPLALFLFLMFAFAPTEKSVGLQSQYLQNKKKLDEFLSGYTIDTTITVNHRVFAVAQNEKCVLFYSDLSPSYLELKYFAIPFSALIECEVIEDQSTVLSGGVGRAVAGAVIAGGVGAVVGAATRKSSNVVNHLAVRIISNEVLNPLYEIVVIDHQMSRNTEEYRVLFDKAQRIYATVIAIMNRN